MLLKLGVTLVLIGLCTVESWNPFGRNGGRGGGRRKHNWGNMTEEQVDGFKKSLRRTNVTRFVNALDRMNEKLSKDIEPTAGEKTDMEERIKRLPKHVRSPRIHELGDDMAEVNEKSGIAKSLYGNDMALSDDQIDEILGEFVDDSDSEELQTRRKRQAFYNSAFPRNLWGNSGTATLYYYFDASLSAEAKRVALLAIAFWQNSTCINFVESTTQPNRVRFFNGDGCYSYVGMIGGVQDLSLGDGCQYFRQASHEIAHALGFFHEQSRWDRDNAITVNTANMVPDYVSQYNKESQSTNNNYDMPYDYGSIMQYTDTSFTSNGGKTMIAKIPVYQDTMGGQIISFYDIAMMNKHYGCTAKCTSGATCLNGGIRNSRNCNSCICPSGWGGTTCAERAPGCGETLAATSAIQTKTFTMGQQGLGDTTIFDTCNYMLQAPAGSKIEVVLKAISGIQCTSGCIYKGIEVKAIKDHRLTGMRYCCSDDVGTTIISEGNIVPVIAFNRYSQSTYTITYRTVPASTTSTVLTSQVKYAASTAGAEVVVPGTGTSKAPVVSGSSAATKAPNTTCTDNGSCTDWVKNGFCTSTGYTTETKRSYCPTACNLCGTTSPVTCPDNANCPTWNQNGFCASASYTADMKKQYCPTACNMCS